MKEIEEALQAIKNKGLYRELKHLEAAQAPYTVINGKRVLLLSSNNYLGLCNDERLKEAAIEAIRRYGVGSGGSRLVSGGFVLHRRLELALAQFKGAEDCMVFGSGYAANVGTIAGLCDRDWTIFCDRQNHASIIDGCRLSGAKLVVYKHCDMEDLEKKIRRYAGKHNLVVTDGVFSMDGDIAPLNEIVRIARKYGILTMVDDAHATGVLGENGAGTSEHFGLKGEVDIQMGTLSKAFAGEGGYVAGSKSLIDYLRHRARSFVYSTAPAPQTVAVALKALKVIKSGAAARKRLLENAGWLRRELKLAGFKTGDGETPIIPVIIGDAGTSVRFSERLYEEGIYIPAIRPPTVHEGTSRLRITLMATHTREDIQFALDKIKEIGRGLEVITA